MFRELKNLEDKYRQLTLSLSDPANLSVPQKIREISKERAELDPVVRKYEEYRKIVRDKEESRKILSDAGADPDLKALAQSEVETLEKREREIEVELKLMLLPKDPYDEKNVILEIRAGAGGDEASLFAQDLFRMYSRYAEKKGWKFEVLDVSVSPIGGMKEAVANIRGKRVYSFL